MEEILKFELNLNSEGAGDITRYLYQEVTKGNIKFYLEAKKGSALIIGHIDVISIYETLRNNLTISDLAVLGGFAVWFINKLKKVLKKEKDKGNHFPPQKIKVRTKEVMIKENEKGEIITEVREIKEDYEYQEN